MERAASLNANVQMVIIVILQMVVLNRSKEMMLQTKNQVRSKNAYIYNFVSQLYFRKCIANYPMRLSVLLFKSLKRNLLKQTSTSAKSFARHMELKLTAAAVTLDKNCTYMLIYSNKLKCVLYDYIKRFITFELKSNSLFTFILFSSNRFNQLYFTKTFNGIFPLFRIRYTCYNICSNYQSR